MEDLRAYTDTYDADTLLWLSEQFSRINGEFYLDHAGATLYADSQIRSAGNDLARSLYANPHSASGNVTSDIVERTRYRILDLFNASSDEYSLIFTSGATASLKCVAETFAFGECGHFVYLDNNHTSVLGMRDVVIKNGGQVKCLEFRKAFATLSTRRAPDVTECKSQSLFVYPAQCNFSGFKYPLDWIEATQNGTLDAVIDAQSKWFVLLDAAGFVGTNRLDLSVHKADFVAVSFYKMFGFPTGIGALIVKNSSCKALEKVYYGGGTVNMALSNENFHVKRANFHERFEDGTISFLSIISLQYGLDVFSKIPITQISCHVFNLAKYLHHTLIASCHKNGQPMIRIYADTDYEDIETQGGIVTFNVLRASGEYVGYMEVLHMAALFKIHLRTGCFCNPGGCQRHLNLSNEDVLSNYDAGYKCGGTKDLIDGRPTGAVRVSFGYMSRFQDVETLILMIRKCFLEDNIVKKTQKLKTENVNTTKPRIWSNDIKKTNSDHVPSPGNSNEANKMSVKTCNEMSLRKLFIYPIKSCAAFEILGSWRLTSKGLSYDREWMIVNSSGICMTQKQDVNLCLIKPTLCLETNVMSLDYPGMPGVKVPLDYEEEVIIKEMCRSRVCGHRVEGMDCGSEVSEWLSLALGRPNTRLIRQSRSDVENRKVELSFSSQAQFLLVNDASVQWLVDRIPEGADCDRQGVLDRFRGNIVMEGAEAFEEEQWSQVKIGDQLFEVMGPCTRCQMVCIDQHTGVKTIEPLRLLAEEFHGKLKFGMYLKRKNSNWGEIRVGDRMSCM